jgi:general secretion pathway protein D
MTKRLNALGMLLALALTAGGCAAAQAFRQGETQMRAGNLDEAVAAYRKAVQAAPDNANYKIAMSRALITASRAHLEKAREFEAKDQLEAALGEYKLASEYDPSNRVATAKVAELDRTIRERIEASRPKPPIVAMRERARAASAEPMLNPASRDPLNIHFNNTPLKDILTFLSNYTGINITYDREVTDRLSTVNLDGLTLEQALNQIMTMNQLSYKVISDRSIFVFQDTTTKHAQYDEQVVRTFYLSHADATEITQTLSTIIRLPGISVQPAIVANKTANTITVRATSQVVGILEKVIEQNDKPRAEIVVDVEILEVDRTRTKNYGLNLSEYAIGAIFSPEVSPSGTTTSTPGTPGTPAAPGTTGTSTPPSGVRSPPPFNLNTISHGVSTADFYLAVPTAIVRFLESDSRTKVIAKPQLRGAEGTKLTLKLGDKVPVISTAYTPLATGGPGVNPLSSYNYQDVGVSVEMTPTVTLEGDIRLDLTVISSTRKSDVLVAGQLIPSFGNREVTTRLRLRDGESNLLAGLLQESEQVGVTGFPGAIHLPILKQLFSNNTTQFDQTDIVMLLTPHIVRTHEINENDLKPIYIGSQQNLGVGGPPPLIAAQPEAPPPVVAPVPAPAPVPQRVPGTPTVVAPAGSSPIPGTVLVQPPAPTPTPPVTVPPEPVATQPPPATPAGTPPAVPAPPATTPPAAPPAAADPTAVPTASPGVGAAQLTMTPPAPTLRVGGGPYTLPISIANASRLSTITLTLIYDPLKLRIRTVQEGSFMRSGGGSTSFTNQVVGNRIDITITRAGDVTGATGTGVLAAILFDAIESGGATLTLSGSATGPGGVAMGLRFAPVTITLQ